MAAVEGCGGFADLRIVYIYPVGKVIFILDGMGGAGRFYWVESAEGKELGERGGGEGGGG